MWFFLPHPVKTYVVAHELTHALWGLLCGARVSHLRVSEGGGSVRLSKSNIVITLAPYFFPLYTILVILLRFAVGYFVHPSLIPCQAFFVAHGGSTSPSTCIVSRTTAEHR
jgi:hypothetical protein